MRRLGSFLPGDGVGGSGVDPKRAGEWVAVVCGIPTPVSGCVCTLTAH